ncbi:MAG: threonine synthase [Cyclonatronaceae bacterium]
MKFYSTHNRDIRHTLDEAVMRGLAPGGGLYMPEYLHPMPAGWLDALRDEPCWRIGEVLFRHLLGDDIPERDLHNIIRDAVNFDAPLVGMGDNRYILELFHGPTLAFKDFGARTMARMLARLNRGSGTPLTVLTATSGDTGAAVADGFHGVDGIRAVILYPSGRVSPLQERQFATLGGNIMAIEVQGSFDDCQRLVKQAFTDADLNRALRLTSANSINIARLLPQMIYYVRAWLQLPQGSAPPVFVVPSGNFGNLTAGLIVRELGLPVKRFIAATNRNRTVPEYLETGEYRARPSVQTISNAMDVGDPSNFARMAELLPDAGSMRRIIFGADYSDEETRSAIKTAYHDKGYIMDPHTAVGWLALEQYRNEEGGKEPGIVLSTAHPAKFIEVMEEILPGVVEIPETLRNALGRPKKTVVIPADYGEFSRVLYGLQ